MDLKRHSSTERPADSGCEIAFPQRSVAKAFRLRVPLIILEDVWHPLFDHLPCCSLTWMARSCTLPASSQKSGIKTAKTLFRQLMSSANTTWRAWPFALSISHPLRQDTMQNILSLVSSQLLLSHLQIVLTCQQ